ncbi:hypothetical protein OH810_31605 (plasmid) [Streptomyces albidoflavus]|uniref:hypothetical protein n=1 Tax=Streptomyces albidoflavus TaxID=1886 RepID=UPI002F90A410|nr:hypothetical protein OH810_31605 [Streptomyces albidoflavus]
MQNGDDHKTHNPAKKDSPAISSLTVDANIVIAPIQVSESVISPGIQAPNVVAPVLEKDHSSDEQK